MNEDRKTPPSPYPAGASVPVIERGTARAAFQLAVDRAYDALAELEALSDAYARALDEGAPKRQP